MLDKPEKSTKTNKCSLEPPNDRILEISQSPTLQFVNTFVQSNSSDVGSTINALGSIKIGQQSIEDAITGFAESVKIGIKVLDELAKLHPFIAAPVLAFKLVVNLDMKRRDNNAKVVAVMVQIQDMLSVLLQLRDVKETTRAGSDGTLEVTGDLKNLMERIAEDIKQCASACDVYLKKSFLRKFLKSPIYEARLADYASKFATHHDNLQLALVSFTAVRVDEMNIKLDEQSKTLSDIQAQFRELFKRLDTPKEREIRNIINEKGGASACVDDESVLQDLVTKSEDESFRRKEKDKEHMRAMAKFGDESESTAPSIQDIQNILRQELLENLDEVLDRNLELFKGKLDIQNKEIKDSIERQGDRIILYFSGGHEKIFNPHIRAIWREMGWRGSIKAVNFVFALRDYFDDPDTDHHYDSPTSPQPVGQLTSSESSTLQSIPAEVKMTSADEWTKKYINISHLQPILESIDDNGSGFISIREVNRFTLDCPSDWSFQQWLAYWAAGWHLSVTQYKNKIYRLLRKMLLLTGKARRDNRILITDYMSSDVILKLENLLRSTKDCDTGTTDPELTKLVAYITEKQDSHMKQNLESIRYKLDSISTVQLVCGPGRIEKHIYPLLYALLLHHIKVFQIARSNTLHYDEFDWCSDSLFYVWNAFDERCRDLKATFKQMQINPETQFENFAFGMFKASEMKIERQSSTYRTVVLKITLDPNEDNDVKNAPPDLDVSILKYGVQEPVSLPPPTEPVGLAERDSVDSNTSSPFGKWTGYLIENFEDGKKMSSDGLLKIDIKDSSSTTGSGSFTGQASSYIGTLQVTGTYAQEPGTDDIKMEIVMKYEDGFWFRCQGILNAKRLAIIGTWTTGSGANPKSGDAMPDTPQYQFIFTRTPADFVRFRYSETEFQENAGKARWKYTLDAVMYDVQRKRFSKNFVFSTLGKALQFKRLMIKRLIAWNEYSIQGRSELKEEETSELYALEMNLPPSIDAFFYFIAYYVFERLPSHYVICNKCRKTVLQSRVFCLTCRDETFDGFDLCLGCIDAKDPTPFKDYVHDTSHSLIRCDYPVHNFYLSFMVQKGKDVSQRVKSVFRSQEKSIIEGESETDQDESTKKKCTYCDKVISLPCWVFLENENKFVCDSCDAEKLMPPLPHKVNINEPPKDQNIMLRIVNSEKAKLTEKDRMVRVEERLEVVKEELDKRLGEMEKRVLERTKTLHDTLEGRMSNVSSGPGAFNANMKISEDSAKHERTWEQHMENRLSAIESRFSGLEETMTTLLDILKKISEDK